MSENEYSFGYYDFLHVTLGSSQNCAIFKGYFYAFQGLFLKSRYIIF